MRKKFGALLLTAVMCTTLVTGCGDKKDEGVSNNDGAKQEEDVNDVQPTNSANNPGDDNKETDGNGEAPGNDDGQITGDENEAGNDGEENKGNEEEPGNDDGQDDTKEPGSGDDGQNTDEGEESGNGDDQNTDGSGESGNDDKEDVGNTPEGDIKTVTASDVQNLYVYGWNGTGVDFTKTELNGWNDGDTASPMTDANGNSVYHSADNWGSDAYLVFEFGAGSTVGTLKMTTTNADILAGSWAVYAGNQLNNAQGSWDVLKVSSEMQLSDGVIEVPVNGAYQYIMIGGYNADDFMNAWVHSWGYMTEIAFEEGTASGGSAPESASSGDNAEKGGESGGNEQNKEESGKDTQTAAGADVQLYMYGWNGTGVDFSKFDLRGWNDNDTASPMTDASGNSMFHSADNWGSDTYLVFDFGAGKAIGTVKMATPNADILADSWAVYGGNQLNNDAGSWNVIMVSSDMQISDGVVEVPVNGTYQYIMIGGHNPDDFMNAWVHSWDYMTEITFTE